MLATLLKQIGPRRNMIDRWLSPIILDWPARPTGSHGFTEDRRLRSYEVLAHAESLLSQPTSELTRVDVITAIRRSIDRRLTILKDTYSLKNLPSRPKPSDTLLILESLGIIRSQMLQKLIDIRNAVEHEDANPPSHETCRIFSEFAWYFLKSTDRMVQQVNDSFELIPVGPDEKYYGLTVDYGPEDNWRFKVWGWIKPEMLTTESQSGWLSLKLEKVETRKEIVGTTSSSTHHLQEDDEGRGRNPADLVITGEVRGPATAFARITEVYFSLI
jgi:hypothetical protein